VAVACGLWPRYRIAFFIDYYYSTICWDQSSQPAALLNFAQLCSALLSFAGSETTRVALLLIWHMVENMVHSYDEKVNVHDGIIATHLMNGLC